MFCNFCGAELVDNSKFCSVCGKKLGDTTNEMPVEEVKEDKFEAQEEKYVEEVQVENTDSDKSSSIIKILKMTFAGVALLTAILVLFQAFMPTYVLVFSENASYIEGNSLLPSGITMVSLFNVLGSTGTNNNGIVAGTAAYSFSILLMFAAFVLAIVGAIISCINSIRTLSTGAKSPKNGYRSFGLSVIAFLFMIVASGFAIINYKMTLTDSGTTETLSFGYTMSILAILIIVLIAIGFFITVAINVLSKRKEETLSKLIVKNGGRIVNFLFIFAIALLIIPGFASISVTEASEGITGQMNASFSLSTFLSLGCDSVWGSNNITDIDMLITNVYSGVLIYVGLTIVIGLMGYRLFKKNDEVSPKSSIALPILIFLFMLCYYAMCSMILSNQAVVEGGFEGYPYELSVGVIVATALSFILIVTNIVWRAIGGSSKSVNNQ